MLRSMFRSAYLVAVVAGLAACGDGTPLAPPPVEEIPAVFTESVIARVDGTVEDAALRLLPTLADATFAAELKTHLDALQTEIVAKDFLRAEVSLIRARTMLEQPAASLEVEDFAHDMMAIWLLLEQTQALIDRNKVS
jgi:predicted small lipoprotein YifL